MKSILIAVIFLLAAPSATILDEENAKVMSETYAYMAQVPLPDGMSVFGFYVPGSQPFELESITDDNISFKAGIKLAKLLRNPLCEEEDPKKKIAAIKASYKLIIAELHKLSPSALTIVRQLLAESQIYETPVTLPRQKERGELYKSLEKWKVYKKGDPTEAFKAIELSRERLETIAAAEAAQRKKEADRRVAEQDTTQAPSTSIAYKPRGKSNGLRRRHLPQDANGANDGTEMDTHTPHSPLIVAH